MYHKDSKTLIKFIKAFSQKHRENRENGEILSKTSEIFIERILRWMEDAESEYHKTRIEETDLDNETKVPRGNHFLHIPEKIKEHLERMTWFGKKISFSIKSRKFNIYFIHPNERASKREVLIWMNGIKSKIYNWLYIASLESTQGCSKDFSIYMYFTDFKKNLPLSGNTINEMNVNTGYTFSCKLSEGGENEMYIYRKEEWFKVFIHETFHSFALDFSSFPATTQSLFDKHILKLFPLRIDLRFYETYCEMWAEILNILYIVSEPGKRDFQIKWRKINEHLQLEYFFSLFQASKILKSMNISYCDLYENTDKAKHKRILNYKEDTPVMSYYILKSIFMLHFGEFIEWCAVNNRGSLNFRKTASNVESYANFIGNRYKSHRLLEILQFMEEFLQAKKFMGGENNDSFDIMKNLRMSMFESSS